MFQVVSVWKVKRESNNQDDWKLIGKKSPQSPQSFYPVEDKNMVLLKGDRVALRCTMLNIGSREVKQGLASYNEMCDMYLVYAVQGNYTDLLQGNTVCTNSGPPSSWTSLGFNNIPETRASSL